MFDTKLRGVKDILLGPLVRLLKPVDPMILTAIGFGFGLGSGFVAMGGFFGLGLGLWILNRLFDGLDGLVARHTGKTSWLGGYLDLLADFAIYAWIPLALVWGIHNSQTGYLSNESSETFGLWLALGFLLGGFYINGASWMLLSQKITQNLSQDSDQMFLDHGSSNRKTTFIMPKGILEGFETMVFYTVFFIFPDQLLLLFWIVFSLTVVSIIQRIVFAINISKNPSI